MSLAWSATITCDRCQRRLIVESATRSPIDGPYVRDVAQHQGWTPLRRNGSQDLCPDCAPLVQAQINLTAENVGTA